MHRAGLIFVLSLLLSWPAKAQKEYTQFFKIENLISRELIKDVAKDEEGYLWIATDEGVLRFDGVETKLVFRELPSPFIKAFLKTRNGKFYVLHDYGIREIVSDEDSIVFRPLTMGDKVFDVPLNYPKAMYEDVNDNLWIGEFNAVVRFNKDGMKRYDLGEEYRSINYHRTFSFAEDAFGTLWIAPFKGSLLTYNPKTGELEKAKVDLPVTEVCGITCVKGDHLLIGGKEGLMKIKVDSDKKMSEKEFFPQVKDISTLISTPNADVYTGTWTHGLYYTDFDALPRTFTQVADVPFNDVIDFHLDGKTNELWVSGSENVGVFKSSLVTTIHQAGLERVESLTVDEQNTIYYSVGQQLYKLDGYDDDRPELVLSADNTYYDRILYDQGKLWIGDAFGRVSMLELSTGRLTPVQPNEGNAIQHIFMDSRGNKWVAGLSEGLFQIDSERKSQYFRSVPSSVVIAEDNRGHIYCGNNDAATSDYLFRYDSAQNDFLPLSPEPDFEMPDNLILNDFQFDSQANLWIATDAGLLYAENKSGTYPRITRVGVSGFAETEPIKAIAISNDFICLANPYGLVIYKDGESILFDNEAGLPSKIIKERGLKFDRENNLLVATAKGIALFGNEDVVFNHTSKPIFKYFIANGKRASLADRKKLHFPYKSRIEAEFVALSFPGTSMEYQTRIVGLSDEWSLPSSNRNLSIMGFSEGSYVLQVRSRERGKLWSEPLELEFYIAGPWFRSWWAILSFVLLSVLIIWVSMKIHNYNLIRQKKNLKRIIEERTEEINRQKNEIIEQQEKIIQQKEELLEKNNAVYKSQQALIEADMNFLHLKEKQLQDQIEYKNKQITTHTLNILQKNETLKDLRNKLEDIVKNPDKGSVAELRKTLKIIDQSFRLDKDWEDFKLYFEQIYTGFYSKLMINYPDLTTQELRHCALIRLNLTLAECASILGISPDSVKVSRARLRKKLNLEHSQSLTDFIMGI